jgi:VanZ family protein
MGAASGRRPSFFGMNLRRARRAAVVWGLFLLALTSWPSPPEIPEAWSFPSLDKVVHGLLYAMEGFFLYFAIAWPGPRRAFRRALAVGGILAVWGTLDEIHQAFIPGRFMEGMDAVIDAAGGFVGGLVASRGASSPRSSGSDRPGGSRGSAPSQKATES